MIKIIEISNCHLWDGLEVDEKTFDHIYEALKNSKWVHSIEYTTQTGHFIESIGG